MIVVYEANLADILYNNSNFNISSFVRIKLADFAHVFPAHNKQDENYLYGLNKLIEHLNNLLKYDYVFKDVRANMD